MLLMIIRLSIIVYLGCFCSGFFSFDALLTYPPGIALLTPNITRPTPVRGPAQPAVRAGPNLPIRFCRCVKLCHEGL